MVIVLDSDAQTCEIPPPTGAVMSDTVVKMVKTTKPS